MATLNNQRVNQILDRTCSIESECSLELIRFISHTYPINYAYIVVSWSRESRVYRFEGVCSKFFSDKGAPAVGPKMSKSKMFCDGQIP